ncbi:MAG: InlB B-repeat-containing protein, partial [Bacteroidales bacterium]|nr:InlB B-repeat-containing protein [Bacteroidales bacterium]
MLKRIPILLLVAALFTACIEPQTEVMQSFDSSVSSMTQNSVVLTCNIHITDASQYESLEYGVFYSDVKSNVQQHQKVKRVKGTSLSSGKFKVTLKNLSPGKTYYYNVWLCTNGKNYTFGQVKSFSTNAAAENGHDYVDLGLSVMWATVNVGDNDYFAWGEVTPKDVYSEENYSLETIGEFLPLSKDAARYQWGGRWRMPKSDEWAELVDMCEWHYLSDGIWQVTGPSGKSILLQSPGFYEQDGIYEAGSAAYYWANQVYNIDGPVAYAFGRDYSGNLGFYAMPGYRGLNIRPVFKNEGAYVVSYDANGGEGYMPEQINAGNDTYVMEENLFTRENHTFIGWNTQADGSGESLQPGERGFYFADDITFYAQWKRESSGSDNGYAYIDMGLSVMWATCNVGASVPEQYGLHYSWGETYPKDSYDWSFYTYGSNYDALTKYCNNDYYGYNGFVDNIMQLEAQDDAATQVMGENWRTPTYDEMRELIDQCSWYWTDRNGVYGYEVTSPYTGNSIFLPAAGYYNGTSFNQSQSVGNYWTSSVYESNPANAHMLKFGHYEVTTDRFYRYYGESVRAVYVG